MSNGLSKLCADFLRQNYSNPPNDKLKASHTCEIVASFFGYKSHAALLVEKEYPLEKLEEAYIFVPDIPLMEERRAKLKGLPIGLPSSTELAERLSAFLESEGLCGANIWHYSSLESYVVEVLLPDCQNMIDDQLSGTMAETNAQFYETPYYDDAKVQDNGEELIVTVEAQYKGVPLDDKPFCGDTIDMGIKVTLPRIAGKRGFYDFELEVGGSVNDDWVDSELKYGVREPDKPKSRLADELGITDDEVELLEYEVQENASNDGQIYDFILTLAEHNPPEILEKIEGLSDDRTIRVSANAFDSPYPDEETHYEVPNIRPKDQWLEMTGGFRIGESPEQFKKRQSEIHALRNRIAQGKHSADDIEQLAHLLGTDEDDEF